MVTYLSACLRTMRGMELPLKARVDQLTLHTERARERFNTQTEMYLKVWIIVVGLLYPAELTCAADRVVREERDLRTRVHDVGIRRSIRGRMQRYARLRIFNGGRVHVRSPCWPLGRSLLQCTASRFLARMSDIPPSPRAVHSHDAPCHACSTLYDQRANGRGPDHSTVAPTVFSTRANGMTINRLVRMSGSPLHGQMWQHASADRVCVRGARKEQKDRVVNQFCHSLHALSCPCISFALVRCVLWSWLD